MADDVKLTEKEKDERIKVLESAIYRYKNGFDRLECENAMLKEKINRLEQENKALKHEKDDILENSINKIWTEIREIQLDIALHCVRKGE